MKVSLVNVFKSVLVSYAMSIMKSGVKKSVFKERIVRQLITPSKYKMKTNPLKPNMLN